MESAPTSENINHFEAVYSGSDFSQKY